LAIFQGKDEKEKPLTKILDEYYNEAKRYRDQFESKWEEEERFYYGEQWKFAKKRPVKNWCFTIVEGEIPILTDSRPGTSVVPVDERAFQIAEMLESGIEYVYDNQNLLLKNSQAVRVGLTTGTGYLYVDWDPDKQGGEGEIIIKNLPWRQVYVDPTASEIGEANYVVLRIPMDTNDLKRRFPKFADDIKPMSKDRIDGRGIEDFRDPTRNTTYLQDADRSVGRFDGENVTVLEEFWVKDYSLEDIPEEVTQQEILKEQNELFNGINPDVGKWEDHDAHIEAHNSLKAQFASQALQMPVNEITVDDIKNLQDADEEAALIFQIIDDHIEMHEALKDENPNSKRPKYPNNMRLVLRNGSTILYDGRTPTDSPIVPLIPIYGYKTEDSVYGISEIRNIISPQKTFNEMDWAEVQGLRLTGNNGWVVDENSGVDTDTLTNEPGIVVKKKQGTEVRRLEPGTISPQLGNKMQFERQAIEAISGINEASQGRRPTGVTAASAVKFLQEQSVGRIRLKTRYLEEYSMLRLGKVVSAYILKFWSTERKLRVYDNSGRIKSVQYDPEQVRDLEYEIRMAPGSTAGLDKESIFSVMRDLLTAGAIDAKTFFQLTDVPYKGQIIETLEQNDQTQAALEQLAAQVEQLTAENQALQQAIGEIPPTQEELAAVQGGLPPEQI